MHNFLFAVRSRPWLALVALWTVAVAVLAATGGLLLHTLQQVDEIRAVAVLGQRVDSTTQAVLGDVLSLATAQRGLVLTGQADYLPSYQAAAARLANARLALALAVADEPEASAALAAVEGALTVKLRELDQTTELIGAGQLEAAREYDRTTVGLHSLDTVHGALRTLVADYQSGADRRLSLTLVELQHNLWALGGTLTLLVLALAALAHYGYGAARRASWVQRALEARNQELARLLETAAAHDRQMQGVAELSQGLQTCHDREEAAAVLGQQLAPLLHARCGALYLVTAPEQLERAFAWGGQPFVDRLAPADCWGLRLGRPFQQPVASGARTCSHFSAVGEEVPDNVQCLPLKAHDELLGLLVLAPDSASFDEVNVEAVNYRRLTLEHVSLSLGNLRLREALRQLAIRDALTGLYNRRFLEEAINLEMARAARKTQASEYPGFVLLMLDIDHFKQFNDQHGHAAGDLALCRVAEALRGQTRGSDVVARYGGEEFIVVLADITLAAALDRAEQMRVAVARLEFRPLAQGDPVLLTVSIGVAHYPTQGTPTLADLLLAVDQALYGAKHAGRNRVTTLSRDVPGAGIVAGLSGRHNSLDGLDAADAVVQIDPVDGGHRPGVV